MIEGLPERITKALKLKRMTAVNLSKEIDYSTFTISSWRRGKTSPSAEALLEMSKTLGVSVDWLLKG